MRPAQEIEWSWLERAGGRDWASSPSSRAAHPADALLGPSGRRCRALEDNLTLMLPLQRSPASPQQPDQRWRPQRILARSPGGRGEHFGRTTLRTSLGGLRGPRVRASGETRSVTFKEQQGRERLRTATDSGNFVHLPSRAKP